MAAATCSRELAARFATVPPAAWAVVLDGLCSDEQLRSLGGRVLRALPNRPVPKDRTGLVSALVPPCDTPHDQLAAFVTDLMKMVAPAPQPNIQEAARAMGAATSRTEYAQLVWASLCGPDETVANAAIADAVELVARHSVRTDRSFRAEELAEMVVRRLKPELRLPAQRDDSTRLLDRVEQTRTEMHGLRDRMESCLGVQAKALRELASRPPGPTRDDLACDIARVVAETWNSPPTWVGEIMQYLADTDRRVQTLASLAVTAPTVRAQREAWRLAHPAAPPRVALVADLENLTVNAREWRGRRINFQGLYERLGRGGDVVSAAAFTVEAPGQGGFLTALQHAGWEPRVRGSAMTASGRRKANWDVGLTLHVVGLAPRVDVVGLATGDGDFADLLEWLRDHGIETRIAAIPEAASDKLRVAADEFITVGDDLLIDPPPANGRTAGGASTDSTQIWCRHH